MKVLFIYPGFSSNINQELREFSVSMKNYPSMEVLNLASITSSQFATKIIDERNGNISNYEKADLVCIFGKTKHAPRMYLHADQYKKLGTPVILGGVHVSNFPDEALPYANSIIIGEPENIWQKVLDDFNTGKLQTKYINTEPVDLDNLPSPNLDLYDSSLLKNSKWSLNLIEVSRNNLDPLYNNQYKYSVSNIRYKSIKKIIVEIKLKNGVIIFKDKSFFSNRELCKELFNSIIPLNIKWGATVDINFVMDSELTNLAKKSGCLFLRLDMVSLNEKNEKEIVNTILPYKEIAGQIKFLVNNNIDVYPSFLVGFDQDDETLFDQIYNFTDECLVHYAFVSILTPEPASKMFQELDKQNRIHTKDWGLYDYINVVFEPANFTPEQLQKQHYNLLKRMSTNRAKINTIKTYSKVEY